MKGLSNEELLKSLKSGDSAPLKQVFETCGHYCITTLRNSTSCSEEDAEDFFVDAVMLFRDNILNGRLVQITNLQSYLYGICLNLQRQAERAHQKMVYPDANEMLDLFFKEIVDDPLTAGIESEFTEELLQICMDTLEQLSDNCKTILEEFYIFGSTMAEIAAKMNLSNANVAKSTKLRCYKKWRELINTHYTSPSI